MRNVLATILLMLFVLPSFAPMMPDNLMRFVHKAQEMHHGIDAGHHHGEHHQDDAPSHSVHFDIMTYFDEVLHLDLKQAPQADLITQTAAIIPDKSEPERIPPDFANHRTNSDKSPVYLSTQRLRI